VEPDIAGLAEKLDAAGIVIEFDMPMTELMWLGLWEGEKIERIKFAARWN
jgi:hypothetical protein